MKALSAVFLAILTSAAAHADPADRTYACTVMEATTDVFHPGSELLRLEAKESEIKEKSPGTIGKSVEFEGAKISVGFKYNYGTDENLAVSAGGTVEYNGQFYSWGGVIPRTSGGSLTAMAGVGEGTHPLAVIYCGVTAP